MGIIYYICNIISLIFDDAGVYASPGFRTWICSDESARGKIA